MAQFTVTGDIDPFLHVSLLRGEKIYCESNAMVMMESALELKGKMTGGLGSALMRRFDVLLKKRFAIGKPAHQGATQPASHFSF